MNRTDTKALAAAIERCEREFPGIIWNIGNGGEGAMVSQGRACVGTAYGDPVSALNSVVDQIKRTMEISRTIGPALTAEYGPELDP